MSDENGGLTYGGRLRGFPFRGSFPIRARGEPGAIPQPFGDAYVQIFDLADETQRTEYQRIVNMATNERATLGYTDFRYDPEKKNWRVLLHWVQWYREDPDQVLKKRLQM